VTLAFPDVSNHNGAMPLEAGTVACLAKASEGTTYRDPYYGHFKAEAARVGALFGAYHFLREGDGAAQADFCFGIVGPGVPTMIDFEPERDPVTGALISRPSVADAVAFRDRFRARGGLVRLNYLPRWYWATPVSEGGLGAPSLAPLADLALVSSNYTAYSDTGPGWESYGGLSPQIWQWTDALPYSGQRVDFNAYRGTLAQLRALLGLATLEADMPLTTADGDLVAARTENRAVGTIAKPEASPASTSLGVEVASLPARFAGLNAKLDAIAAAVAPVDVKALAASLASLVQPAIVQAVQAGIAPEADQLAVTFEQHLAAALAQGK